MLGPEPAEIELFQGGVSVAKDMSTHSSPESPGLVITLLFLALCKPRLTDQILPLGRNVVCRTIRKLVMWLAKTYDFPIRVVEQSHSI